MARWCWPRSLWIGAASRRRAQLPDVTCHAWKAQQRLYAMYHRLSLRRGPQIAVVAVARELVGYLSAVMRDVEVAAQPAAPVAASTATRRHACRSEIPGVRRYGWSGSPSVSGRKQRHRLTTPRL